MLLCIQNKNEFALSFPHSREKQTKENYKTTYLVPYFSYLQIISLDSPQTV